MRQGHVWGDDFAMYIAHARNIVEGRPYADTGYIFNPDIPIYAPTHYPPVFPILLAPLYKVFGLNLRPMKVEQVAFLLLALVTIFTAFKRELNVSYSLALIAILGFSPVFWSAKDSILSDVLFLFWFYLAAVLAQWDPDTQHHCWIRALLLGVILYLGAGTRTVGASLIPGFLLYEFIVQKRLTRFAAAAVTVCVVSLMVQRYLLGGFPGGYLEEMHLITLSTLAHNGLEYVRVMAGFWVGSVRNWFAYTVLSLFALCVLRGTDLHRGRGLSAVECFLVPYLVAVLLWPFSVGGIRYLFPAVPWIGLLAMGGLHDMARRWGRRVSAMALAALLLFLAIPCLQAYRALDFGPIRESYNSPHFAQLCQAVRQQTRAEDVVIYGRARALSLYTARRTSAYNYNGTDAELWNWFNKTGASYLVTTTAFSKDRGFLERFVTSYGERVELTYQNAEFRLYRILASSEQAPARLSP